MASIRASTKLYSDVTLEEKPYLGVIIKAAFRLRERLEAAPELPEIHLTPVVARLADGDVALRHDSDWLCFHKPLTDVLLRGVAYSPGAGATSVATALRLGRAEKHVTATGPRKVRLGAGARLDATAPEPFETMHLGWENAYGGRDEHAETMLGVGLDRRAPLDVEVPTPALLGRASYPRNRRGRGFRLDLDRERFEGLPLPALSDPADPVHVERLLARDDVDWADRPLAASYEPIDPLTFPRCVFAGLWPERTGASPLAELRSGALLESDVHREIVLGRPDPRAFNCAPAGLAVCRLEGGERLSLHHLHPHLALFECELPRVRPRAIVEPKGTRPFELKATLGTVLIEPGEERITLTWTAAMPTANVFMAEALTEVRHGVLWD